MSSKPEAKEVHPELWKKPFCKDCAHGWFIRGVGKSEWGCLFLHNTNEKRGCMPHECKKTGRFVPLKVNQKGGGNGAQ